MKISTRIGLGYALILILFAIVTYVNFQLEKTVSDNTQWLSNSERVIRVSAQLQRGIIDMENAFRGYLLTSDEKVLNPYYTNDTLVPQYIAELKGLITAQFQVRRLDTISLLYNVWHDSFSSRMIRFKRESDQSALDAAQYHKELTHELQKGTGKNITERIRNIFREFNDYEYQLRARRRTILNQTLYTTSRISISLIILSIIISILSAIIITRIISKRIAFIKHAAGRIASGNFKGRVNDGVRDELTSISRSLDKMAKTLDESFTDLARKNADLNQFAYIVSHDLKAPLRGIQNVFTWINEDLGQNLDPQLIEYHKLIEGRVKRMENLINGILEFSRIGRTQKPVENVDLKELIYEIIDTLSPPRQFRFIVSDDLPVLRTERIYIEQVFTNLISNAIKYSNREDTVIEIGIEDIEGKPSFYVKDNGPGIEEQYHERIFAMFQTLKERDAFESTGIGLTIVKKIVEEHGGKITVESAPGEGTKFVFSWPMTDPVEQKEEKLVDNLSVI